MKILITGANGMLGSNLSLMYSKENEVIATSIKKPDFSMCSNYKMDIRNKEELRIIENEKPDLLVHCAALVNVDYCEENPEKAKEVNAVGTKNVAEAVKKANSYLVHISTDAVFNGEKGNYLEEDETKPINIYGETKLDAEKNVQAIGGNYIIIRTNIYGWNRQKKLSLAEWMLNKLKSNKELAAFKDIIFSPILVNNLGEAILELYKKRYKGLLHVAGNGSCSKFEFAQKIAKVFNLNKGLINAISVDDINLKAERPRNISLNIDKAKGLVKTKLLNIEEGLQRFKELKESGFIYKLKNE
jgi:dTDP-4-dehydrorhamnose reductase